MRTQLQAVICFLLLVSAASASSNDIAVDPDGTIYSISQESDEVVISRLVGDTWKIEERFATTAESGAPALTWAAGGLLAAWTEDTESGTDLVFAFISDGKQPVLQRHELSFRSGSFALEALSDSRAGMLVMGEQARWLEIDVESVRVTREMEVAMQGKARFPSILPGSPSWIAWEERNGEALHVTAARIESGKVISLGRFAVRGFGSVSMPVLAQGRGPTLVWQGVREGSAALFSRLLSDSGFGPVRLLPSPNGLNSVIQPRRAVGSFSSVSASTWNNVRWSAVRYDLGEGQPSAVLRVDEQRHMLRPVMVAGKEETWLWTGDDGGIEMADSLSERVFESPAIGPALDDEMRYLAFGDSITAGKLWLAASGSYDDPSDGYEVPLEELHGEILGPATVVNKGLSSETTVEGLVRLQALLEVPGEYDRVLLLEGTNDFNIAPKTDSANEITIPNLIEMVSLIRAHGAIPIVGTMLPRDRHPISGKAVELRAKEVTAAMIPVMQRLGVRIARFQELFPLDDEHLDDEDERRVHPTLKGYALMARIWMEALLTFEGDVNRDGKVDYLDAQRLSAALGARLGSYLFNPDSDMNLDGIINVFDLSFIYRHFGTVFFPDEESGTQ